jgi:hypothetical protein
MDGVLQDEITLSKDEAGPEQERGETVSVLLG